MIQIRYGKSRLTFGVLSLFSTCLDFQLTVGKWIPLYSDVYFANISLTRVDIEILEPDLDSHTCWLQFDSSRDRETVCYYIW